MHQTYIGQTPGKYEMDSMGDQTQQVLYRFHCERQTNGKQISGSKIIIFSPFFVGINVVYINCSIFSFLLHTNRTELLITVLIKHKNKLTNEETQHPLTQTTVDCTQGRIDELNLMEQCWHHLIHPRMTLSVQYGHVCPFKASQFPEHEQRAVHLRAALLCIVHPYLQP